VRILYLHGFASSPDSKKGMAMAARFGEVERLDLRVPSAERLSLAAMIETTRAAIGDGPVVLIGSSLGGLTAAWVAASDPRVARLVLFAPAFRLAERWQRRLSQDPALAAHADFLAEAAQIDVGFPDVRVPTLILHGVHDDVVPVEISRAFAADRPHVRLIELDDDHQLLTSIPRLLSEIELFLRDP
jgi:pimeloyl-ACP methyl ester carboxylesterase